MIPVVMAWFVERLPDGPSLMRALAQLMLDATPVEGGIADLSDALVLVPASRARRSFERQLSALAQERGIAAIAPQLTTPGGLVARFAVPRGRSLGALGVRAAWQVALERCDPQVVAPLFPETQAGARPEQRSVEAVASRLATLHRDCASAGLGFAEVRAHVAETMPDADPARWDALVAVDAARDALLREAGVVDPASESRDAVNEGALRIGALRRVYVLLADPEPLQRMLLRALDRAGVAVTVAVAAIGDELPAALDRDGCPEHAAWARAAIDVPDEAILLAGGPADQAAAVMDAIAAIPAPRRTADISVAVPDPAVASEVAVRLPTWGVPVTALPGRSAADGSLGMLLAATAEWLASDGCDELCTLVRHPDIEGYLEQRGVRAALQKVADFGAETGARTVPDAGSHPAVHGIDDVRRKIDGLLLELITSKSASGVGSALRAFLDMLVRPAGEADREAGRAAIAAIEELESMPDALGGHLRAAACLRLVRESMAGETLPSEGSDDGVELMGWLEAGVDDAPHLVVTGMNEGTVPEGMVIDPWLPDSARERLGMPCALRRQARDAWILHGLLRRKHTLRLVTGAVNADGEPMQPSRLLLGLRGDALARRVLRLVDERAVRASATRWSSSAPRNGRFGPRPMPAGAPQITTMSVTSFRDWLQSPALFLLKRDRRLKLQDAGGPAFELDPMGFGSLVHEALEAWGREAAERTAAGRPPETDVARIERDVLAAFRELREVKFVPNVRGAYEVQFALAEERLRWFAREQARWAGLGWRVLRAEQQFDTFEGTVPSPLIGPSLVRLSGRIDRVDMHPELGHAALDYKTTSDPLRPEGEHRQKKTGAWIDLQLPLYRVLLRSTGIEVGPKQLGYFALPANPSSTEVLLAHDWDEAFMREAEAEARRIAALVEAGDFSGPDDRTPGRDDPFAPIFCDGMRGLEEVPAEVAP